MPTLAYNNLQETKKQKLIEDGILSFNSLKYRTTNVFEITKTLGITRTAFYYYFTDKDDFYETLVNYKKEEFLKKHVYTQADRLDIFELLVKLFEYLSNYKASDEEGFFLDLIYNIDYVKQNDLLDQIIKKDDIFEYTYINGLEKFSMDTKDEVFEFVFLLFEIVFHSALNFYLHNVSKDVALHQLKKKLDYLKNGIIKEEYRGENIWER